VAQALLSTREPERLSKEGEKGNESSDYKKKSHAHAIAKYTPKKRETWQRRNPLGGGASHLEPLGKDKVRLGGSIGPAHSREGK